MLKLPGRHHKGKERVLVIGLDGVPFRIIKNFIKMNVTPFLGELSGQGLMREMISCIPPVSSVAWTSMVTGVNPASTASTVYGKKTDSYEIYFPNATHIKSPTLWDILGSTIKNHSHQHTPDLSGTTLKRRAHFRVCGS